MEFLFWLYAIVVFIVVLLGIIMIHEGGHFFFAKKAGILCHEYSCGMGPLICQKKKGETAYSLRCIPIGGYVAMAGENMNEDLLKVGSPIGLNLTEKGTVKEIVCSKKLTGEVTGDVVEYNLYSKNGEELHITLKIDGVDREYLVERDAFYVFSKKEKTQIAPYDRCFESKTKWQRFITIFAGPLMNFVLALVIFLIVGLASGVANTNSTKIGEITKGYGAEAVGLKKGDVIKKINGQDVNKWKDFSTCMDNLPLDGIESVTIEYTRGESTYTENISTVITSYKLGVTNYGQTTTSKGVMVKSISKSFPAQSAGIMTGSVITGYALDKTSSMTPITSWKDLLTAVNENDGKAITFYYYENNDSTDVKKATLTPKTDSFLTSKAVDLPIYDVKIGVSCGTHFSFFGGLLSGLKMFGNACIAIFATLAALFKPGDGISVGDLSGPVGILAVIKSYLNTDFLTFLAFVGMLSANIGIVNLLPIPALDGGRIVFILVECITRKPVNKKVETWLNNIVFILLMVLFVFITIKDVIRLF